MKKIGLLCVISFYSLLGFTNPPPAQSVFELTTKVLNPNAITINWSIKKGFFLYQRSIKLSKNKGDQFDIGEIILPKAHRKMNKLGKTENVFKDSLNLTVPILGRNSGEALLDVHFQGCSEEGFCYPPQVSQLKLTIDNGLSLTQVGVEELDEIPVSNLNKTTEFEQLFLNKNWAFIIFSCFGFGLLLSFTPCVLPMIPVLSGIIVGHGKQLSPRKGFFLSLSYVMSMSVTYSLIGAVIAFMGNNLQVIMQSTWAITLFSLMFILLALSMFGLYELRVPVSWQNKMASFTRSQSGGHYLSAGIMGCLSILILSPCVTAPLVGVLGYIAHEGNVVLGIISLFFLGLGMGTPLLLIGASAGKLLPKAGRWMNEVKAFFGVLMLAVAIYLLSRILPQEITMGLWSCLFIFSGIYLGALSKAESNLDKFNQGLGLIILVYGFLILIGAALGHNNPLLPLKSESNITHESPSKPFSSITVKTIADAKEVLANAMAEKKIVLIDFYADWCASCKLMAKTVLQDPMVLNALNDVVVLTADITTNNMQSKELMAYFQIIAPPVFLFYDTQGHEMESLRLVGEITSQTMLDHINAVKSSGRKR